MPSGYQQAQTEQTAASPPYGYALLVVELSDKFGPRRHPDKPNLRVDVVIGDPYARFDQIKLSGLRHSKVREFGIRVRGDLTPKIRPPTDRTARASKTELIKDLNRQGYSVNGYTTVWHVYVIELKGSVGPRMNPQLPWVYVGQTSRDVELRYRQHADGVRNSRGPLYSRAANQHHLCLRPDLYENEPTLFSADDAKHAEREFADRLRRAGYSVKGGH
jgi:hypothetical protein